MPVASPFACLRCSPARNLLIANALEWLRPAAYARRHELSSSALGHAAQIPNIHKAQDALKKQGHVNLETKRSGSSRKKYRLHPHDAGSKDWERAHKEPKAPVAKVSWSNSGRRPANSRGKNFQKPVAIPPVKLKDAPTFFEGRIQVWAHNPLTFDRLVSFGVSSADARHIIKAFVATVRAGDLSKPAHIETYGLDRFAQPLDYEVIDSIYSSILFAWVSDLSAPAARALRLSEPALDSLRRISSVADCQRPSDKFPSARRLHRKLIMHVGPTNSGKTHHALMALAASNSGVYAGPLRLLAHEIWERLNLGQIVPLGMDPRTTPYPDPNTSEANLIDKSVFSLTAGKQYDPRFVRPCNMITGEEKKIVSVDAGLLSCTVEMLNVHASYDVAVVDEIQMIADPQRGSAWTNAVLGLVAKEIHLCGEEGAVPIIKALLKETGDELQVRRYERLTPLTVEKQSLDFDFRNVKKGDCIITFTRSNIFQVKKEVEARAGLRCAVVYGKLPPEIRSEQAALFNDPTSGYDVMVGSDAIGMGLNLKIRRIIFTDVVKRGNTGNMIPLSVSAVKQIAGRAGRFGLLGDSEPGGFVTTLQPADLPFLRKVLAMKTEPLIHVYFGISSAPFAAMKNVLPRDATTDTIMQALKYASRMPSHFRHQITPLSNTVYQFIDEHAKGLTVQDRLHITNAPIQWRDQVFVGIVKRFVQMYEKEGSVDLGLSLQGSDLVQKLVNVETKMNSAVRSVQLQVQLAGLETLHRVTVLYRWMSFRNPVAYPDVQEVGKLKARLEVAMAWCLERLSTLKTFSPTKLELEESVTTDVTTE